MHLILAYAGIFLGIFMEGEMIMLSSIIAAHHGYLNLWIVIAIGITGTYSSDCFYFFLGRIKGNEWLNKHFKMKNKIKIIDSKVEKHPVLIFISYRFAYGLRTITPTALGLSSTKTNTFLLYSAISTIIWATLYSSFGYMFGEIIKLKLSSIEHIEKYIMAVIVLIGFTILLIFKYRENKK